MMILMMLCSGTKEESGASTRHKPWVGDVQVWGGINARRD